MYKPCTLLMILALFVTNESISKRRGERFEHSSDFSTDSHDHDEDRGKGYGHDGPPDWITKGDWIPEDNPKDIKGQEQRDRREGLPDWITKGEWIPEDNPKDIKGQEQRDRNAGPPDRIIKGDWIVKDNPKAR